MNKNEGIVQIKIAEINKRMEKQEKCDHPKYRILCSVCGKTIRSEKLIAKIMIEHKL